MRSWLQRDKTSAVHYWPIKPFLVGAAISTRAWDHQVYFSNLTPTGRIGGNPFIDYRIKDGKLTARNSYHKLSRGNLCENKEPSNQLTTYISSKTLTRQIPDTPYIFSILLNAADSTIIAVFESEKTDEAVCYANVKKHELVSEHDEITMLKITQQSPDQFLLGILSEGGDVGVVWSKASFWKTDLKCGFKKLLVEKADADEEEDGMSGTEIKNLELSSPTLAKLTIVTHQTGQPPSESVKEIELK